MLRLKSAVPLQVGLPPVIGMVGIGLLLRNVGSELEVSLNQCTDQQMYAAAACWHRYIALCAHQSLP